MASTQPERTFRPTGAAEELLKTAILELGISARAYDEILKVSRMIANMEGAEIIGAPYIRSGRRPLPGKESVGGSGRCFYR